MTVVALLGYLIMPDSTPYANDMMPEVKNKPSGFRVQVLKIKKDIEVEQRGFIGKMLYGQENPYEIKPLAEPPRIVGDSVYFVIYPGKEKVSRRSMTRLELSLPLIQCVKSIYVPKSEKLGRYVPNNYTPIEDGYAYLDVNEVVRTVTYERLEKEFWENNVEERVFYLGSDRLGRDVLSRLMYGARISLMIGVMSLIISLVIGTTVGALAGYFGGKLDAILEWLMTVVWSLPSLMLVIAIRLMLDSDKVWITFMAVGLTMWVEVARVVRGEMKSIKEKLFIEAARALGYSDARIIFRHILPNLTGSLVVISASNFGAAILIEAGFSFLGIGGPAEMPSWGKMIYDGINELTPGGYWHLILYPCISLSITVLALNLIGSGLRDVFDPKASVK
ncbi:hypothetical protein GCM10023331_31490 [Algivirga pacifica]|uniref:ABC transmembrane type-1 domain-containing protein n=2 Tax=Algivirga pacifica TaxID=1162670 RepID=A0ABP9DFV6_9BACT